jgi:hypothetical protein
VIFTKNISKIVGSVKVRVRQVVSTQRESGSILFSGFMVALLGVSGVNLDTSLSSANQNQAIQVSLAGCQKELLVVTGMRQVLASEVLPTEMSPTSLACAQAEAAAKVLADETTLTPVLAEELPAVTEAKEAEEELKTKRVAAIEKLLKGSPMTAMAPAIAEQDTEIAALIVGIARKESQWGVHSPRKNGSDCFNYWGFKGAGGRGVGMGHACFATREEAVEKVAKRLEKLVKQRGTSKPSSLVTTWKCGRSCAGHSKESVNKWVSDVNQYYTKMLAIK